MEIKLFEIRDRMTFIPAMAVQLGGACEDQENWLLSKAGYGNKFERDYVFLTHLQTGDSTYDVYKWGNSSRTMREAHRYILENWDKLKTGDVIDVEFILNESTVCKTSERDRYGGLPWDM